MNVWLCESCKHRRGKLRTYHRVDSDGVERAYKNSVKVCCAASKKHPHMVRDAVKEVPYYEPWRTCIDYKARKPAKR